MKVLRSLAGRDGLTCDLLSLWAELGIERDGGDAKTLKKNRVKLLELLAAA